MMDRQTLQVLKVMRRDGQITRLSAAHYGIANVTSRIADLRIRHGVNVQCDLKRDAEGARYGAWRIVPTNPPGQSQEV